MISKSAVRVEDARKSEEAYTLRAAYGADAKEFKKWVQRWSPDEYKRKRARKGKTGADLGRRFGRGI